MLPTPSPKGPPNGSAPPSESDANDGHIGQHPLPIFVFIPRSMTSMKDGCRASRPNPGYRSPGQILQHVF